MKNIIIISISIFAISIFPMITNAQDYQRAELLEEGRGTLDTITKYKKISQDDYPGCLIVQFTTFSGYNVDSTIGTDEARVTLANLTTKIRTPNKMFSFYGILDQYEIKSQNRNTFATEKDDDGSLKPAEDKDGNIEWDTIRYGALSEVYLGFEINVKDITKINTGLKYSRDELYNCDYEKRDISGFEKDSEGIVVDDDGKFVYRATDAKIINDYHPIVSVGILDNFKSVVSYSKEISAFDAIDNILRYKFSEDIGYLGLGHTYYRYWDFENGLAFNWEKIFELVNFGSEYLKNENKISNIYTGVEKVFQNNAGKLTFTARINYSRTPDTMEDEKSNKFAPGGLIDITFLVGQPEKIKTYCNFHIMYNDYQTLRIFRGSLDKLGLGAGLGVSF